LGFAAHGHAQGKKSGQKVSTGQNEILSEKNTPEGPETNRMIGEE
jgi:hypothetical protein